MSRAAKQARRRLAALCAVVMAGLVASVTSEAFAAQPTAADTCGLVCRPGEYLDSATCHCLKEPPHPGACALVCPKPNEVLDAANCRCVKTGPGKSD